MASTSDSLSDLDEGLSRSQFIFVGNHDGRYIRSHVMRQVWSNRREKSPVKSPRRPQLLAIRTTTIQEKDATTSSADERMDAACPAADIANITSSTTKTSSQISKTAEKLRENPLRKTLYNTEGQSEVDTIHDTLPSSDQFSYGQDWKHTQLREYKETIPSWEVAKIDPFQTHQVSFRPSQHLLIHHWITVFGAMMFGRLCSSINPMAEVWIPEALNNEASFQGMLSYAAAHLAHLRGQSNDAQVTAYKIKALESIQKLLNNELTALSDSTVGAILRQISIEDRFGSPRLARLHREGLQKIIEKRGGPSSFRANWSLELLLNWYLLTSKPTFHSYGLTVEGFVDRGQSTAGKNTTGFGYSSNLPDLLAKFVEFFRELRVLRSYSTQKPSDPGLGLYSVSDVSYPAHRLLYLFANAPTSSRGPAHNIIEETCRLACLFYMAAIKADSVKFGTSELETLMFHINETQKAWEYSIEMLLWVLLRGSGPGLEKPETVHLVHSLMEVAKLLKEESWNVVKEILIGFLCDDPQSAIGFQEESTLFIELLELRS